MSKIYKVFLLAQCSGLVFSLWVLATNEFFRLTAPNPNVLYPDFLSWFSIRETIGLFILGAVICMPFGAPFLLFLDRYFSDRASRYLIGGAAAGWITWFFFCGPLLTPSPWFRLDSWVLDGINHVLLYVGMGFATGSLFSLLLLLFWPEEL